jgi:hypothetical protein
MLIPTRTLIQQHFTTTSTSRNSLVVAVRSTIPKQYSTSVWNSLFSHKSVPILPNIHSAASSIKTNHHYLQLRTTTELSSRAPFSSLIHSNYTTSNNQNIIIQSESVRNMSSSTNDATVIASAIQLLKDTPYFYNASDSLLQTLATKRMYI